MTWTSKIWLELQSSDWGLKTHTGASTHTGPQNSNGTLKFELGHQNLDWSHVTPNGFSKITTRASKPKLEPLYYFYWIFVVYCIFYSDSRLKSLLHPHPCPRNSPGKRLQISKNTTRMFGRKRSKRSVALAKVRAKVLWTNIHYSSDRKIGHLWTNVRYCSRRQIRHLWTNVNLSMPNCREGLFSNFLKQCAEIQSNQFQ